MSILRVLRGKVVDKFSFTSTPIGSQRIPVESENCYCDCGEQLKVRTTQTRKVVLLDFGELIFNEKIKYCPGCKSSFGSGQLSQLVPEYSNFGFEIIEFVGKKLFIDHSTEREVLNALEKRNVKISPR